MPSLVLGDQATGLSSASGGMRQLCRSVAGIARRGRRGRVSQSHRPAPVAPPRFGAMRRALRRRRTHHAALGPAFTAPCCALPKKVPVRDRLWHCESWGITRRSRRACSAGVPSLTLLMCWRQPDRVVLSLPYVTGRASDRLCGGARPRPSIQRQARGQHWSATPAHRQMRASVTLFTEAAVALRAAWRPTPRFRRAHERIAPSSAGRLGRAGASPPSDSPRHRSATRHACAAAGRRSA
jgi:hypothetical protein